MKLALIQIVSKPNYQHNQNLNFATLTANLHIEQYLNNINTNEYCRYIFNLNSTLKESVRGQKSDTERKRSRE